MEKNHFSMLASHPPPPPSPTPGALLSFQSYHPVEQFCINILLLFNLIVIKSAGHSKANKEAKLMEKKICFILDAGNLGAWGGGRWGWASVQRPTLLPHWQERDKSFYRWREGGPGRNSTVSSVIVNGLGAVSLQFQGCLFPFPWGQLSELWQLCHGCNLVIKWLTSPIWSGFQYL